MKKNQVLLQLTLNQFTSSTRLYSKICICDLEAEVLVVDVNKVNHLLFVNQDYFHS